MKKRWIAGSVLFVVLLAVTLLTIRDEGSLHLPTTPTPSSSPTPTPNPLSIQTIRQHPITASTITSLPAASRGGCQTRVVSFQADGFTEHALAQLPSAAAPAGGYPVIVLAHGYINPATYQTTGSDYQTFMNAFCQAGYAIFKLDYRGNGRSQGTATVGDIEPGYSYDLLNFTASLATFSPVNANRVAWLGHSMGGAVVLRAAVASHNLPVKAIVLASGVVGSLEDTLYNWPASMLPADLAPQKAAFAQTYGTPTSNPAFWHDVSAINYVAAITAPVEINHGTADAVVPILFSKRLDAALTAVGKAHVFYTYPGGDHQYGQAGSGAAFISNTLAFLGKYDQ